ncbi:hypothetical protein [Thalassospira alkalitolerans]|uniref:hypothetical protein n=1 Tax=Thalassospira alkalitolerans TaxID=1293890 RepID=UPI003AA97DF0
MLVYANHLTFEGHGAKEASFKAIGAWLKEKMGYGLHPNQLKTDGSFEGTLKEEKSWLRIYTAPNLEPELPELYAWVLRNSNRDTPGRHWITELGLKKVQETVELSCILKTDEQSTLVSDTISASRPRVMSYVINNIKASSDIKFSEMVPGNSIKTVGSDRDTYRGLLVEIERQDRNFPLVLVSPTRDGEYLINTNHLQDSLFGLAQVITVSPEFDSYEMEEVLGQPWSAWNGAVNILHIPTRSGFIRGRFFQSDVIEGWGTTQHDRVSELLAWVTNNTNILQQQKHIRPEGVMQLALHRHLHTVHSQSKKLGAEQLQHGLEEVSHIVEQQTEWIKTLEEDNSRLMADTTETKGKLEELDKELNQKEYALQSLKDQLNNAGKERSTNFDTQRLLELLCRTDEPTPMDCIEIIESLYGDKCIFLSSAKSTARDVSHFIYGRRLMDMMKRLVTEYRRKLIEGGDAKARSVFGKSEYAAKESETVMASKPMRQARTFEYEENLVEMFSHLKIGIDDDDSKTIRVHFHWDAKKKRIVIGYVGKHLPIASH